MRRLSDVFRRLILALSLIVMAAALLLWSDWHSRLHEGTERGDTLSGGSGSDDISRPHLWKIRRIIFVESPPTEEALRGMDEGFREAGLLAGKDFSLQDTSAQGDLSVLPTLVDAARNDGTELLIVFSTPALQMAIQKFGHLPIVFCVVANPMLAGAGQDYSHHLSNVTGVATLGPYAEMAGLLSRQFPGYRRVGTLFSPAEDNSVFAKDLFTEEAAKQGISVTPLPVNSPGELPDAALALASRPLDAIVQIPDNQTSSGFTAIGRAAARARKPLFTFIEAGVQQGAALGYVLDYRQAGYDAALKVVDILRGQSPANIPFSRPSRFRLIVSEENAHKLGMVLPPAILSQADPRLKFKELSR